jgi:hypothetical protein
MLRVVDRRGIRVEWRRDYGDDVECFVRGRKGLPVGLGATWTSALADLLWKLDHR